MDSLTLYGMQFSPYVRKVRLALAHKGLAYEHSRGADWRRSAAGVQGQ